ncbi:carbon storage regulator [Shewanella woodyi]|uniref:carbon storage regulator n=1 Tax=Shewanella woodyi TaxID=60961 RepID=UPI0003094E7E|nr:carbon storage regulator [Shewanella woodyi]
MLILTRKANSSLILTNIYDKDGQPLKDIEVHLYHDNRVGIDAAPSIDIYRSEILDLDK